MTRFFRLAILLLVEMRIWMISFYMMQCVIKQNCLVKLIASCWMMILKPLFVCLLCLMIILE